MRQLSLLNSIQKEIKKVEDGINFFISNLGVIKNDGFEAKILLLKFSYNSNNGKRTALIVGGIHGNEPASVKAILNVIDIIKNNTELYKEWIIHFIPIVNPWGFANLSRHSENHYDINRDFKKFNSDEARLISKFLKDKKFDLVIDLHEDRYAKGFYLFSLGKNNMLSSKIISGLDCNIENDIRFYTLKAKNGIIKVPGFVKRLTFIFGRAGFVNYCNLNNTAQAYLFETPKNLNISERVDMHVKAIDLALRNYRGSCNNHGIMMNRIYKFQRYIYDPVRKFILFGRDQMLDCMQLNPNDRVLEIGCGTARNLIKLSKKYPHAKFYGIDASTEMLKTAEKKIKQKGLAAKINVVYAFAENFNNTLFNSLEKFDAIFFSYSLSMIPDWQKAINQALNNLNNNKKLFIVDFWDQKNFPSWFQVVLKKWLKLFKVEFKSEQMKFLKTAEVNQIGSLQLIPVFKGYSYIAVFTKHTKQ